MARVGTASKNTWNFLPTTIPSCSLWLDAADLSTMFTDDGVTQATVGSSVQYWKDKSINNSYARQTTLANKPVLQTELSSVTAPPGLTSLYFSGSPQVLALPDGSKMPLGSSDGTYFVVCRVPSNVTSGNLAFPFSHGGGTAGAGQFRGFFVTPISGAGFICTQTGAFASNSTYVPTLITGGIKDYIIYGFLNGNTFSSNNLQNLQGTTFVSSGGTLSTNAYVGAPAGSGGVSSFVGNVCEIVVYNRALNNYERQQVEGYLAWKWGVPGFPEMTHPYYTPLAQGFSPMSILSSSACRLWLDASKLTGSNDSAVNTWADLGGFGNSGSNTGNTAPTLATNSLNGLNTVAFNGSQFLNLGNAGGLVANTSVFTLLFVAQSTKSSPTTRQTVFTQGGTAYPNALNSATPSNTVAEGYFNTSNKLSFDTLGVPTGSIPTSTGTYLNNYVLGETLIQSNQTNTIQGWEVGNVFSPQSSQYVYNLSRATARIGASRTLSTATLTATTVTTNIVTVTSTVPLYVNQLISFTLAVGNIVQDAFYYITSVSGSGPYSITISTTYGGSALVLATTTSQSIAGQVFTTINATTITGNKVTIISSTLPTVNQTIIFGTSIGGIIAGSLYYITSVDVTAAPSYVVTLSLTSGGTAITITSNLTSQGVPEQLVTNYLTGNIAEMIYYNSLAVSTTQRQRLEGYLAWKWGLQAQLPTSHPFYLANYFYNSTRPSSRLFAPPDIEGCQMWIDPTDTSTVGYAVSQWTDKSSGGNNATQSTASLQPYYIPSQKALYFGTSEYLSLSNIALFQNIGYASMFIVMRIPPGTTLLAQNTLFVATGGTGSNRFTPTIFPSGAPNSTYGSIVRRLDADSDSTLSSNTISYPYGGITILNIEINYSTNTATFYRNGTQDFTGGAGLSSSGLTSNTASTGITISSSTTSSRQSNFYIHEILVYTSSGTALTSTDLNNNNGYLAWKWGIQNSLPSSNTWSPFNTSPASSGPSVPVTGSKLWLDASDSTKINSGSTVAMLTDKSGSDNSAVNSASTLTMTTYTKPEGTTLPILLGPNPGTSNSLTTRNTTRDTSNHTYAFVVKYPIFNPTSISGCAMWFDAANSASVILSGNNVMRWNDLSGNGRDMLYDVGTITYNATGFNGKPTITLGTIRSGFTYNTPLNLTATNSLSFYIVLRPTTSSGNIRIMSFFSGGVDYTPPGVLIGLYNPTSTDHKISVGRGTPYACFNPTNVYNTNLFTSVIFNGNLSTNPAVPINNTGVGVNGTFTNFTGYSIGTNFSTYNPVRIGEWSGITSDIFNGNISEILMFNRALNLTENQQVEGYLAWKWGLQANLPAGHPYLSASPVPSSPTNVLSYYSPPTTAFTPTQISGCSLWLDAADNNSVVLSGSNVTQWNDKSGNGNNAVQLTQSSMPTYINIPISSQRGIYFASNSINLTTVSNNSTAANTSRTIFAITYLPNTSSRARIGTGTHSSNTPPSAFGIDQNPVGVQLYAPYVYGSADNVFSVSLTGLQCIYAYYDSSVSQIGGGYGFNTFTTKSTTLNTTATPWYFGLRPIDSGGSTTSYVCEFIQYNTVLTTAQRQQVEGYLAWKWGLVPNLPASHPYYSVSPNTSSIGGTETFGHSGTTAPILQNNNAIVGGGNTYAAYGTYASADAFYGGSTFVCLCVRQNGVWTFTTNGQSYTTVAPNALKNISSGQYIIQVNNSSGIQLGDVIVYNSALTSGEQQQLEGYLAWKWGIQRSGNSNIPFPTTHPFYKYPPVTTLPLVNATQLYKKTFDISDLSPAIWLDANDPNTYTLDANNRVQWMTNKGLSGLKAQFTISAVANGTDFTINNSTPLSPGQAFEFSTTGVSFTGITTVVSTPAAPVFFYVHSYFDTSRIRISSTFGGAPLTGTVSSSVVCYISQRFTRQTGAVVVTAASGSGTIQTYTCVNNLNILQAGQNVTITGLSPAGFNVVNQPILTHSTTQITVSGVTTGNSTGTGLASLPTQLNGPLLTQSAVGTGNGLNYLDFSSGGTFKITGGSTDSAGTSVVLTLNAVHNIPSTRQVRVVVSGGTYSTDSTSATGITGTYIVSSQTGSTITIPYTSSKSSATINNLVGYVEYGSIIISDISMVSGSPTAVFNTSFPHGLTTSDSIFLSLAGSTIANFPVALNLANGVYTPSAVTSTSFTITTLLNLGGSAITSTGTITNTSLISTTSPSYAYFPYNGYALESMSATGMLTNGANVFVVTHTNPGADTLAASSIARCGRNVETQPPIFAVASTVNAASGTDIVGGVAVAGSGRDFNVRLANYNAVGNQLTTSTTPSIRLGIERNSLSTTSVALTDTSRSVTNTTNGFRVMSAFINLTSSGTATEPGSYSNAVASCGWKPTPFNSIQSGLTGNTPLGNTTYANDTLLSVLNIYQITSNGSTATATFVPYGIEPTYNPLFVGQIVYMTGFTLGAAVFNSGNQTITAVTPTTFSFTTTQNTGLVTGQGTAYFQVFSGLVFVSPHIRIGADTNATTSYSSLAGYLTDRFFDGGIAEIIVIGGVGLTPENRMLVEGYLAQKYNFQDYLGSTTNAITNLTSFAVTAATSSGTTATITFTNPLSPNVNPFVPGAQIVVAGITPAGYSGTFVIVSTSGVNQVSYSIASTLGSATLTSATASSTRTQTNQFIHPYRAGPSNIASNLALSGTFAQNLALWYDAANYSSLTLSGTSVLTWSSRLGNIGYATNVMTPPTAGFNFKYVANSLNGLPGLEVMSTVALTGVVLTSVTTSTNILTVTSSTPIVANQLITFATATSGIAINTYYVVRSGVTGANPYSFTVATSIGGAAVSIPVTTTGLTIQCQLFTIGFMSTTGITASTLSTVNTNNEFTYFYVFKRNFAGITAQLTQQIVSLGGIGVTRFSLADDLFSLVDSAVLAGVASQTNSMNYATRGGLLKDTPMILSVYKRGRNLYSRMIGGGKTSQFVQTFSRDTQIPAGSGLQVFVGTHTSNGTTVGFNGTLYEMMFFRDVLTDQAIQQTEGYLAQKWGLTGSLPQTHAYYEIKT